MSRILVLIILLWIIYTLIKFFIKKAQSNGDQQNADKQSEKVVACAKCGLHVPESETHITDGKVYCNNPNCNN